MTKELIEEMKNVLTEQKNQMLESLAEKNADFKKLVNTVESGDAVDIASDAVDRTLLDSLSAQDSERIQMIDNALTRLTEGAVSALPHDTAGLVGDEGEVQGLKSLLSYGKESETARRRGRQRGSQFGAHGRKLEMRRTYLPRE